ncbi:2-dehydropantoate 2-reductase [Colwellia sp. 6_MG-2023]|uniref:ketopantoate reductase family protein n=1 Tax=Colwellia sp. 6_MG-2023 TaxID=3062676 RepID=UPI0026E4156A|nr:2-dehydropantoate 2-reductase [Colwellia sp. 6_MG-2023]MDO6486651.1 2-dehydropantoate 2-reductase [Colwellia sp. 6_MG-2023]
MKNIIIVGQGAIGLLWYHHILQLINNHGDYNEARLHLLPSKRIDSTSPSAKPRSNKTSTNQITMSYDQYSFTDHNGLVHQGKINYAQTEDIEQADLIIFCVKAFQISLALDNIANKLKSNITIVLAHNGMGTLSELSQNIIKHQNIYALLTTHGCLRSAPFTVTHTGVGSTDIGLLSGVPNLAQQESLTKLLNTALPQVTFHQEINKKQWLKLAINCVINPLTAINDISNGEINNAEYSSTILILLEEVVAVADAEKVNLDLADLKIIVKNVAQATAKNSSSMRCDITEKRTSEIDYINGYIHRLGIKHKLATPENTKMWQAVSALS